MAGLFGVLSHGDTSLSKGDAYCGDAPYADNIQFKTDINLSLTLKKNTQKAKIYSDPRYCVALLGHIYNVPELRNIVKETAQDHPVETVIVKLFKQYGTASFELLKGSFACVLYDIERKIIYLVRDKTGTKPLYFYSDQKSFIFGTSLKDFTQCALFSKRLDPSALALYFQFSYIPQPYSIFEKTYKINPGSCVSYHIDTKVYTQHRYWNIETAFSEKNYTLTEAEVITQVHAYLQKSIALRVHQNTKYGAFLSGGYDSALIAALLQKQSSRPIMTFTIGFHDSHINEAPEAKKIASYLGTEHIEHYATEQDALETIQKLPQIYDEPLADHALIPSVLISDLAKTSGTSLLFGGDGGDEIFATQQYLTHYQNLMAVPEFLKQILHYFLKLLSVNLLPFQNTHNFEAKRYKLLSCLSAKKYTQILRALDYMFIPDETKRILSVDFQPLKTPYETTLFKEEDNPINVQQGLDILNFMVNSELVKSYSSLNFNTINFAAPYLDDDLMRFIATVPTSIMTRNFTGKHISKQIAHQYMPTYLFSHEKSGFSIPLKHWMQGVLKPMLHDLLHEQHLKSAGILNASEVEQLKKRFYSGETIYKYKLWSLLNFQLWYDENIR